MPPKANTAKSSISFTNSRVHTTSKWFHVCAPTVYIFCYQVYFFLSDTRHVFNRFVYQRQHLFYSDTRSLRTIFPHLPRNRKTCWHKQKNQWNPLIIRHFIVVTWFKLRRDGLRKWYTICVWYPTKLLRVISFCVRELLGAPTVYRFYKVLCWYKNRKEKQEHVGIIMGHAVYKVLVSDCTESLVQTYWSENGI